MAFLEKLLGEKTYTFDKDGNASVESKPGLFGKLLRKIGLQNDTGQVSAATPMPFYGPAPVKTGPGYDQPMLQPGSRGVPLDPVAPIATPMPTNQELADRIHRGFVGQVGKVPALEYIPQFVEATQYPIFKENPYLAPQIAILETSGGKYITRPNNLINYGIRDPKINELFGKVGIKEALERSLKEIGQTGRTYERFRTGKKLSNEELQDFARTYEPMNESYYENLRKGIEFFERQ